jgi:hypothetical protein
MNTETISQTKLRAHGNYPKTVFRAFKDRAHAEDFVEHGRFRMGNLRTYTEIEDEGRKDSLEGQGHFQRFGMVTAVDFSPDSDETMTVTKPGYVETHIELLNPKFIFSCSLPSVDLDLLRKRFGPWLVKIKQPRQFAQDISDYLETLPYRFAGGVEGCFVQYNKEEKTRRQLRVSASTPLAYMQKSAATFSVEKEFRFVVIVSGKPSQWLDDEFLSLNLGRKLDYVDLR